MPLQQGQIRQLIVSTDFCCLVTQSGFVGLYLRHTVQVKEHFNVDSAQHCLEAESSMWRMNQQTAEI